MGRRVQLIEAAPDPGMITDAHCQGLVIIGGASPPLSDSAFQQDARGPTEETAG
jgi:hypothetical protein